MVVVLPTHSTHYKYYMRLVAWRQFIVFITVVLFGIYQYLLISFLRMPFSSDVFRYLSLATL